MKIGDVDILNHLILAPMAGVSDLPFRLLCRQQGAGLAVMEMVSCKAILYKNKNTFELMRTAPEDHPVSLQLFGSDPDIVSEAAAQIEDGPYDIIDFNMGCPVPKIVKNGEGSALMRNPSLAAKIVRECVRKIRKPMTVKIRKGFNEQEVNVVELAKMLEDAGAAAIAVHGRTREQFYSGKADWDIIRDVKEAVRIPVIGNGDVDSVKKAHLMQAETGCDAVMIGRAARGNPWVFREEEVPPDIDELKETILRHAQMTVDLDGEYAGIRKMRKHVAWYTAGRPHSSRLRGLSNSIATMEDLRSLLTLLTP